MATTQGSLGELALSELAQSELASESAQGNSLVALRGRLQVQLPPAALVLKSIFPVSGAGLVLSDFPALMETRYTLPTGFLQAQLSGTAGLIASLHMGAPGNTWSVATFPVSTSNTFFLGALPLSMAMQYPPIDVRRQLALALGKGDWIVTGSVASVLKEMHLMAEAGAWESAHVDATMVGELRLPVVDTLMNVTYPEVLPHVNRAVQVDAAIWNSQGMALLLRWYHHMGGAPFEMYTQGADAFVLAHHRLQLQHELGILGSNPSDFQLRRYVGAEALYRFLQGTSPNIRRNSLPASLMGVVRPIDVNLAVRPIDVNLAVRPVEFNKVIRLPETLEISR